jgi:excisionase family DNA binding protein
MGASTHPWTGVNYLKRRIVMNKSKKEFLRVKEVAEILGIPKPSIYELIRNGKIEVCRFSERRTRVHVAELDRFIEEAKA